MNQITFGELFAGVGGFSLGFERAGWSCRFQVEWDAYCQQVLAHHWPDVPRFGDVCDVNGAELPPVDVLSFGSPCQDLSVAGKRAGLEGGRSGMFYEATRIIKEMRNATRNQYPRVAVWENVPGAFTSNAGRDFGAVLDEMVDCGALVCEWAVLDAQNFGVPQRRRRIFLVAIFDSGIAGECPDPLLPVREGMSRDCRTAETVAFYSTHGTQDREQYGISPPLKAVAAVCVAGAGTPPRKMTPVEHERLMGWPDNHTLHRADGETTSDTKRYKMCGNGVASPCAHWIAQQLTPLFRKENT